MLELDDSHHHLALGFVGHADDRSVTHLGHRQDLSLDLGGIDVDPATDDQIGAAVADEEPAILVEVPDVPGGDEPGPVDRLAALVIALVGEVAVRRDPGVDVAHLARRERPAVGTEDRNLAAGDGMTHGSGLAEPFLTGAGHGRAAFGGAVELGDDWPPPLDHRPFHLGRAWARRVHDMLQARHVVAPPRVLGKPQEVHEHGRHQEQAVHTMPLNEA